MTEAFQVRHRNGEDNTADRPSPLESGWAVHEANSTLTTVRTVVVEAVGLRAAAAPATGTGPVPSLYGDEAHRPEALRRLSVATSVINEALPRLAQAAIDLTDGNKLASDENINEVAFRAVELFGLRKLGIGFAMITNSIHTALAQRTDVLNSNQIDALTSALTFLRDFPFCSSDNALNEIDRLDSAGLSTDPEELSAIAEALDDSSEA